MQIKSIKQIKSEIRDLAACIWPGLNIQLYTSYSETPSVYVAHIDDHGTPQQAITDSMQPRELHAYLRGLKRGLSRESIDSLNGDLNGNLNGNQ